MKIAKLFLMVVLLISSVSAQEDFLKQLAQNTTEAITSKIDSSVTVGMLGLIQVILDQYPQIADEISQEIIRPETNAKITTIYDYDGKKVVFKAWNRKDWNYKMKHFLNLEPGFKLQENYNAKYHLNCKVKKMEYQDVVLSGYNGPLPTFTLSGPIVFYEKNQFLFTTKNGVVTTENDPIGNMTWDTWDPWDLDPWPNPELNQEK